jgi:hypothetical protein
MNQYLLEYMGSLVICYVLIFSHENPILVGLAHTAVLYIARSSELEGHFTPISVIAELLLGRLKLFESSVLIAIHILAAFSIVLIYQQKTLM